MPIRNTILSAKCNHPITDAVTEPTTTSSVNNVNSAQLTKTKPPNSTTIEATSSATRPPIRSLLPVDLNAELKSRLKKSTHASVGNLRKSATTSLAGAVGRDPPARGLAPSATAANVALLAARSPSSSVSSDTDGTATDPSGKDLGKLLRSLSKENVLGHPTAAVASSSGSGQPNPLSRALSNISQRLSHAATGTISSTTTEDDDDDNDIDNDNDANCKTSDGESSGGREVKTIIKNSAVARRKKFNDG